MKKKTPLVLAICTLLFCCLDVCAQTAITVTGNVKNSKTKESVPAVSVIMKGGVGGAYTDDKGNFKFTTTQKPPFTLVISSLNFATKEVEFTGQSLNVELDETSALGQDIVVAASRLPERILIAPVTIERVNTLNIRNNPGSSYYDALNHLKG